MPDVWMRVNLAMRGEKALFKSLQPDPKPTGKKTGRNPELVKKRNEALCYRYLYYIKILRRSYSDTLTHLEQEFFLSKATIILILFDQASFLKEHQQVNLPELEARYPYFNWQTI